MLEYCGNFTQHNSKVAQSHVNIDDIQQNYLWNENKII